MSTLAKRWRVAKPAPPSYFRKLSQEGRVLAQVLYNRGYADPADAQAFLYSGDVMGNPFALKGVSEAVSRLRRAINKGELIVIYGDFDADGVTSTALLMHVFTALGANVKPYIPHRVDEGYGLNSPALLALAKKGAKVVVTVDCGIRSVQEVVDGKRAGLDIIITDHHSIGPEIPPAYAVINPKQADCKYPEDMLAGVGVAYKLAEALLRASQQNTRRGNRPGFDVDAMLDNLLDFVALGTVADLAPLDRLENRLLVQRGLNVINRADRLGVAALLEVAGIEPGGVSATSIGFMLGPRINAAGRISTAMKAYNLLSAQTIEESRQLAEELQQLNSRRQELTRASQRMVQERLEAADGSDVPLIFASDDSFEPGIVGLVAGRLTEAYYRPSVVLREGDEESTASCRSIPEFNITHALDLCGDLLVRHGGHEAAAGLTVRNENIMALKERLIAIADETLSGQDLLPVLDVDIEVPLHALTEELVHNLHRLEPTGHKNSQPVMMTRDVQVMDCRTVGKDDSHLKLTVGVNGTAVGAIGFGLGEWAADMPRTLDVAYQLEINEWNGRRNLQLNMQDIRPAGME